MRTVMLLAACLAAPAWAEDAASLREFCGDRPGLGTPACIVDKGHLQVELGLGDWTLDRQPDSRTDTILAGDAALRLGVTDSTELRLQWTAYGHVRVRDRASGAVDRAAGIGDVTVGLKQSLRNPDGSGLSLALLPFATLPSGRREVGAGDWGAGLVLPVDYQLDDEWTLELTPEIDAAVDEDGHGRHLAYSGVVGVQAALGKAANVTAELQALRDRDPEGHETRALAGLSLAYQPGSRVQLDAGVNAGLDAHAPDVELYFGVSEKF